MSHTRLITWALAGALVALAPVAEAKKDKKKPDSVGYVGIHPVPADAGGGFCYIETPHFHVFVPDHADLLYRVHDGHYHFVGDPVPFGYKGPTHGYYGPHPIPVDIVLEEDDIDGDEVEYCYLDGPHLHYYAPPPEMTFALHGGVYWFVGEPSKRYQRERPALVKVNLIYATLVYERPIVVIEAPPGWHAPVVEVVVKKRPKRAHRRFVGTHLPVIIWIDGHEHHHHHDDD